MTYKCTDLFIYLFILPSELLHVNCYESEVGGSASLIFIYYSDCQAKLWSITSRSNQRKSQTGPCEEKVKQELCKEMTEKSRLEQRAYETEQGIRSKQERGLL